MTPFRVTLALMLVMVVALLAAGCTGENHILPPGKYVYLEHSVNEKWVTVTGSCAPNIFLQAPLYSADEQKGQLNVHMCPNKYQINGSLFMFYALRDDSRRGMVGSAKPLYSLPDSFTDGVTIYSVMNDGVVILEYRNRTHILKPKERLLINTTKVRESHDGYNRLGCTQDIVTTDSFYNAGMFDKQNITVGYLQCPG